MTTMEQIENKFEEATVIHDDDSEDEEDTEEEDTEEEECVYECAICEDIHEYEYFKNYNDDIGMHCCDKEECLEIFWRPIVVDPVVMKLMRNMGY